MRQVLIFFLSIIFFFSSADSLLAQNIIIDPSRNNKFGIHIVDENDLHAASNLVNSGGGKWGYVTFVIREDERDIGRWSRAFTQMEQLNLIPIVRIATTQENGVWRRPDYEKAKEWAVFLDQLPWPIKNRYVILFNEPNHAKEWGGRIDPVDYARIARRYWEELKKASPRFFVLPAGLDADAPNGRNTMNSLDFFDEMYKSDQLIFSIFDGLTSHSYPNPGFSGSPSENGKNTIRGFEWELSYLSHKHLIPNAPVFITETGWVNHGNEQEKIASYYKQAFSEAWANPRVVAVTPFLLRYDSKPFDKFSWKIPGTNFFYPYYREVLGISKVEGNPDR